MFISGFPFIKSSWNFSVISIYYLFCGFRGHLSSRDQLTRQEQVVLDEVSKLQIEKEIGDGLCISPDTVNTHINNMKKKIKDVNGLSPRTKQELIAYKISTITGKAFDLKKVREYGIQVLLIMINVCSLIHK